MTTPSPSSSPTPRIKAGVRWVSWGRARDGVIPGYAGEAMLEVPTETNAFNGFIGDWIKQLNVRIDGMPDLPFWGVESVHWTSANQPLHLALVHRAVEFLDNTMEIGLAVADFADDIPDDDLLSPHKLWQVILSTPRLAEYGVPAVIDTMLVDLQGMTERDMHAYLAKPEFLESLGMDPVMETPDWMVEECRELATRQDGFSVEGVIVSLEPFEVDDPQEVLAGIIEHDEIRASLEELLSYD